MSQLRSTAITLTLNLIMWTRFDMFRMKKEALAFCIFNGEAAHNISSWQKLDGHFQGRVGPQVHSFDDNAKCALPKQADLQEILISLQYLLQHTRLTPTEQCLQ